MELTIETEDVQTWLQFVNSHGGVMREKNGKVAIFTPDGTELICLTRQKKLADIVSHRYIG